MKVLEKKALKTIKGGITKEWPDGTGYTECHWDNIWQITVCHAAKYDGSWSQNGYYM